MSVSETDGYAPVTVHNAGKPCQTFYKIVGDLSSGKIPLIVLNGGPGSTYTYVFSIKDIATLTDLPVVFYDQIGGGKSTHLPEKNGDVDFWTVQIFVDEFHSLLRHLNIKEYNVLGHSWGAVLGMEIAIRQPAGLRKLVLSSGPVSMELWVQVTRKLLETLPADLQVSYIIMNCKCIAHSICSKLSAKTRRRRRIIRPSTMPRCKSSPSDSYADSIHFRKKSRLPSRRWRLIRRLMSQCVFVFAVEVCLKLTYL